MGNTNRELVVRDVGSDVPHPLKNMHATEIMSSELCKIVVKSDDKTSQEVYIHSGLLASLSPSLDALVNGGMKEAQEKSATWTMEAPLFTCFMTFAYTGTYDASICYELKRARCIESRCTDVDYIFGLGGYIAQSAVHIYLMIFADYRDIQSLYDIAFCRLKADLSPSPAKTLFTGARAMLIELLGILDAPVHVIRDVMQVAVQDVDSLWKYNGFREALDDWSDLKTEFLNMVMDNIGSKAG